MKHFLISLWTAIKQGILRIFPLPQKVITTCGEHCRTIVFVIVSLALIGCATPKQVTQLVRDTRTDTLYLTNQQYDSIYIYKEHSSDFKPSSLNREERGGSDTVYLKDVSIEYRYKLLRDTVRIIQRDSIPYEVTITEVKEITRPLHWYDKLLRIVFWMNIGFAFYWIYRFLRYFKIIKL